LTDRFGNVVPLWAKVLQPERDGGVPLAAMESAQQLHSKGKKNLFYFIFNFILQGSALC
jgi:hypothetical protein